MRRSNNARCNPDKRHCYLRPRSVEGLWFLASQAHHDMEIKSPPHPGSAGREGDCKPSYPND